MADNREPVQGSDDLIRAARGEPSSTHSPSEAMVRKAWRSTENLGKAEASASVEDSVPVAADRPEAPEAAITFSWPRRPPRSDSSGRGSGPPPSPPRSREPLPGPARGEQRRRGPLRVVIPLLVVGLIVGSSLFDAAGDNAAERPSVTTVTVGVRPPPTGGVEPPTIAPRTTSARPGPGPSSSEFTGPGEITVVGGAAVTGPVLRLTDANRRLQAAAAWLTTKQHLADGFTTTFRFRLTDAGANPGDGFAFVIQNSTGAALGDAGAASGIGYKGIRNSVAVEFDTTYHDFEQDPRGDHIAVHTHGTEPNTAHRQAMLGWVTPAGVRWQDQVHMVRIDYTPDTLSIFLDDLQNPVLEVGLNLSDTLRLDDGAAWVGFTASTEPGFTNRHDVLEWSIESHARN